MLIKHDHDPHKYNKKKKKIYRNHRKISLRKIFIALITFRLPCWVFLVMILNLALDMALPFAAHIPTIVFKSGLISNPVNCEICFHGRGTKDAGTNSLFDKWITNKLKKKWKAHGNNFITMSVCERFLII